MDTSLTFIFYIEKQRVRVGQLKARILAVLGLLAFSICALSSQAQAQTNASLLTVTMSAQNWSSDMWSLKETTPEKGLIVQINIQNSMQGQIAEISSTTLRYQLIYVTNPSSPSLSNQQILPSVIVPSLRNFTWYLMVLSPSTQTQLGDYSLKVSYSLGSLQWYDASTGLISYGSYGTYVTGANLEPYPLNFKVVSESRLQQDIQQLKQSGTVININIGSLVTVENIGIGSIVSISLVAAALYFLRKKR